MLGISKQGIYWWIHKGKVRFLNGEVPIVVRRFRERIKSVMARPPMASIRAQGKTIGFNVSALALIRKDGETPDVELSYDPASLTVSVHYARPGYGYKVNEKGSIGCQHFNWEHRIVPEKAVCCLIKDAKNAIMEFQVPTGLNQDRQSVVYKVLLRIRKSSRASHHEGCLFMGDSYDEAVKWANKLVEREMA